MVCHVSVVPGRTDDQIPPKSGKNSCYRCSGGTVISRTTGLFRKVDTASFHSIVVCSGSGIRVPGRIVRHLPSASFDLFGLFL